MSDEFKVQWSVSLPPVAQYAKGDMLNLRGNSVEEVEAIFDQVLSGEFLQKATDVSRLINAAATLSGGTPAAAPAQAQPNNVTPLPTAGSGELKTCSHGVREYKTGTNKKTGKAWAGWFCPETNKSAQCAVVWKDD